MYYYLYTVFLFVACTENHEPCVRARFVLEKAAPRRGVIQQKPDNRGRQIAGIALISGRRNKFHLEMR